MQTTISGFTAVPESYIIYDIFIRFLINFLFYSNFKIYSIGECLIDQQHAVTADK